MNHDPVPDRPAAWRAAPWSDLAIGEWREDHYQGLTLWTVAIESRRGRRLLYCGPVDVSSEDKAAAFAARINRHIADHPDYEPKEQLWNETYPVYGSDQYEADQPQIVADERRQAIESEMYPDNRFQHTCW
jgi:hypothetical protein